MKSSVGIAIIALAGLAATAVGIVRRVRRLEQELEQRLEAYEKRDRPSFEVDLPPNQQLNLIYLKKPTPIFYLHQT